MDRRTQSQPPQMKRHASRDYSPLSDGPIRSLAPMIIVSKYARRTIKPTGLVRQRARSGKERGLAHAVTYFIPTCRALDWCEGDFAKGITDRRQRHGLTDLSARELARDGLTDLAKRKRARSSRDAAGMSAFLSRKVTHLHLRYSQLTGEP